MRLLSWLIRGRKQKKRVGFCPLFFILESHWKRTWASGARHRHHPHSHLPWRRRRRRGGGRGAGVENRRKVGKSEEGRKRWCFVNLALGGNPGVMRDRRDLCEVLIDSRSQFGDLDRNLELGLGLSTYERNQGFFLFLFFFFSFNFQFLWCNWGGGHP